MRFWLTSLTIFFSRSVRIANCMQIYDLNAIAVGIVKIGMTAGKAKMTGILIFIQQDFDSVGFQVRHGGIEILAGHHEGVVDKGMLGFIGRLMVTRARQDEIFAASAHEYGVPVLPPIGATQDLFIKRARFFKVADPDSKMKDTRGFHSTRRRIADRIVSLEGGTF